MDAGDAAIDGAAALHLAELIATRLCHDLSGPLSGLGAALGEVAEDPAALDLVHDGAAALRERIALLRMAWGSVSAPLDRDALRTIAAGLSNAHKLRLELDGLAAAPAFAPAAARVVANVLLVAAESLPLGGMLAFGGNPAAQVVVTIAGPRAAWPAGLGAMLADADAAWRQLAALQPGSAPRALPGPLTALLARQAGVRAALLLAPQAEAAPPLLLDFGGVAAA